MLMLHPEDQECMSCRASSAAHTYSQSWVLGLTASSPLLPLCHGRGACRPRGLDYRRGEKGRGGEEERVARNVFIEGISNPYSELDVCVAM